MTPDQESGRPRPPESAKRWKERLYIIIFYTNTPAGKQFDTTLLWLILASLVVVMLDSVPGIHQRYELEMAWLEWLFTGIFAVEYLVRVYCHPKPRQYIFSFYGAIDLLSILPAFIALAFADAQYLLVIRVVRMLRIFRVLKLTHYLTQANFLLVALQSSRQKIAVFFLSVCTLVVVFGTLMYVVEGPEHGYTSIPISIYWAIVTLTTVGFGDIVPQTAVGKALASMVMVTGYSIIAVPTGIFTAELANAMSGPRLHQVCPSCRKASHDPEAAYCARCGSTLFERQRPEEREQVSG